MTNLEQRELTFESFVRGRGKRLRQVMVARYGLDVGCDASDAALAWAWENWERVDQMDNPAGYLFRVGQTHARRAIHLGRDVNLPAEHSSSVCPDMTPPDDDLASALRQLSEPQRMAVLMVHAYGWSPAEVAEFTGMPAVTVRSHLRRALRTLRRLLDQGATT